MNLSNPIKTLIITGSMEGHTTRIGQFIAQKLEDLAESKQVTLKIEQLALAEANQVSASQLDLASYQLIIIGASIHYGHFPKALDQFVKKHAQVLEQQQAYFFGINLTARKADKCEVETNVYVRKFIARHNWPAPRAAVFAGALNYSILKFYQRHIIRFIMFITKGDTALDTNKVYTNWQSVEHFAKQCFAQRILS